ncbi:6295_t:CDS:2 [Racocetra fulgida]|uniref:6295_t:CDS:1 n=1 Tax=Racocetra fulgida TaxID=60492 RepID=A0A9N9HGV4_9GLOM|nr:6295_t:CDS:2 [Racocetra fulgida]
MASTMSLDNVPEPTQAELSDLQLAAQKLWELDRNRLEPVNQIPTYKAFYALLDNYIPQTGIPEVVDDTELKENTRFLKACLQTGPLLYAFKYLQAKGVVKGSITDFEEELNTIWFNMYRRQGHDADSR